jgi:hypothetical protein
MGIHHFTIKELKEIRKILENTWDKRSCYEKEVEGANKNSKSYGQCYATAGTIKILFGGKLLKNKEKKHYWNLLPDGTEVDFTSDQFKGGDGIKPIFKGETAKLNRKNPRVKHLLKKFKRNIKKHKEIMRILEKDC